MKRRFKLITSGLFAMALLSMPLYSIAQQGPEMKQKQEMKKDRMDKMEEHIPDLTVGQKESIKAIHLATMKDVKPLRNELGEKEAKFRTLNSADKPDMAAINKQIDDIAVLKASITKRETKARQDIRALLNDDQRIAFDMHRGGRMEKAKHKSHH